MNFTQNNIVGHTTPWKVLAVMKCLKFQVLRRPHVENQFYDVGVLLDHREGGALEYDILEIFKLRANCKS